MRKSFKLAKCINSRCSEFLKLIVPHPEQRVCTACFRGLGEASKKERKAKKQGIVSKCDDVLL